MSRYDKYDGVTGGFRAKLAADWTGSENLFGVGLDTNGRVVVGAGTTGIIGVLCKPAGAPLTGATIKAGTPVDVMTSGDVVEFLAGAADPGSVYCADTTTGVISLTAASATKTPVGFTTDADRLVVRVNNPVYIGT